MQITDAVAVVTGAAGGLGFATAQRLADAGAHVVLMDLPGERGEKAAAALGGTSVFAGADVTDEASVRAAFDTAAELGPVRIVVNCAGVAPVGRILARDGSAQPLEPYARAVMINLVGTYNVLRLGAEKIVATEPIDGERGVIVNTASVAAFDGQVGQVAYSSGKGGVVSLTLPAARDLAQFLVRVVAIAPGLFDTEMLAGLPEAARESLGKQVPHPSRLGRATEYAALVEHIVSNPMLNGEVIRLDGAIRMAPR